MGFLLRFFEILLQGAQRLERRAFELMDPALVDFVNRHGIEVVQFLAAAPDGGDEVGVFEDVEMFGHSLAGHVEVRAQPGERPPVVPMQEIEEFAATGVAEGFEHVVHDAGNIRNQMVACQAARFPHWIRRQNVER
jgi:hypothetical protein